MTEQKEQEDQEINNVEEIYSYFVETTVKRMRGLSILCKKTKETGYKMIGIGVVAFFLFVL